MLAAACIGLSACGANRADKVEVARPVLTIAAVQTDELPAAEYAGTVRSRYESRLSFRSSGQVTSRTVELGAEVVPGQVLMRLDPKDAELSASSAHGQMQAAELAASAQSKDLERAGSLLAEGFISKSEYDRQSASAAQAVAQLNSARSQHGEAARQVGFTALTAPRASVVGGIQAEAGDVVAAGQPVITIADPAYPEVAISIPEDQVAALESSGAIWVTLWANPGERFKGRLRSLSKIADSTTRTFDARIVIEQPAGKVRLGQTAEVFVSRRASRPGISIPLTALDERGGRTQVWILNASTLTVRPQAVVVGGVDRENALITSGLKADDQVVVSGVQVLRPGERVKAARLVQSPKP
jgi:RND family efflux transporter MFP subunit